MTPSIFEKRMVWLLIHMIFHWDPLRVNWNNDHPYEQCRISIRSFSKCVHPDVEYSVHTVKNICLDLTPGIAEFIKRIASLVSQGTILNRCHDIDKYIILKHKRIQIQSFLCNTKYCKQLYLWSISRTLTWLILNQQFMNLDSWSSR